MDIFWILDPDPHNNRCGSATLNIWLELELEPKYRTKVEPEINNLGSATL